MKLYTLAFGLITAAIAVIGDSFTSIALAAGMLLAAGLCVALAEVRSR